MSTCTKKKLTVIACVLLIVSLLGGILVNAGTDDSYLCELPEDEREEIILQKENNLEELASDVIAQPQNIDYSSKEAMFESFGFSEKDLRDISTQQSFGNTASNSNIQKEYIYDRMLNTMDFYDSLQGKFDFYQEYLGVSYSVEYAVNADDCHESYEIIQFDSPEANAIYTQNDSAIEDTPDAVMVLFDGKNQMVASLSGASDAVLSQNQTEPEDNFKLENSVYIDVETKEACDFASIIKATSRVQTDEHGINTYYYRENLNGLMYSRESIDPQELAFGYLSNFDTWKIAGESEYLGRKCVIIEGMLSGSYSEKLHTVEYKLWVDYETGILLKSENYDETGNLSETLTTSEIAVDIPFEKNVVNERKNMINR